MFQLNSSDALATSNGVKCLVYGRSGLGKTVLCATAPAPIIISAESGLLSLRKSNLEKIFGVGTQGITYDIPVISITNVQQLVEVEQWLRHSQDALVYQTICIDSVTEVGETVLSNAKGQVKDPRQAYGELIEKMVAVIKSFRDMPGRNVYMSAKEERFKDDTNRVIAGPAMPGSKLGPAISYYFDEVFHLGSAQNTDGTDYRYLRTAPNISYDAKDRSGALDEIEYPHLGYVFNKIIQVESLGRTI